MLTLLRLPFLLVLSDDDFVLSRDDVFFIPTNGLRPPRAPG